MRKSDIAAKLAQLHPEVSSKTIKQLTDRLFNSLNHALSNGKRIEVRGFGTFALKARKAGVVRNPRHGIFIESEARHVVHFRAGKELRIRIDNQKTSHN